MAAILFIAFIPFAALYLGIFGLLSYAAVKGTRTRRRWLQWVAGVPAALLALAWCSLGWLVVYFLVVAHIPSHQFAHAFGVPPSEDIHDLQTHFSFVPADGECIYMKFRASPEVIEALVPERLKPCPPQDVERFKISGAGIGWWDAAYDHSWQYWSRNYGHDLPFGAEIESGKPMWLEEFVAYNPETGWAYYCRDEIY